MANSALTGIVAGAASQAEQEAGSSTTVYVSPGRQQFHPSAAKAWVNFNGTGTVAIRRAYNVTSITDNGVGDYTINFTTAMSDANYAVVATGQVDTAGGNSYSLIGIHRAAGAVATTSARIVSQTSAFTNVDYTIVNAVIFGDM